MGFASTVVVKLPPMGVATITTCSLESVTSVKTNPCVSRRISPDSFPDSVSRSEDDSDRSDVSLRCLPFSRPCVDLALLVS